LAPAFVEIGMKGRKWEKRFKRFSKPL